jgi:hypothetical protein
MGRYMFNEISAYADSNYSWLTEQNEQCLIFCHWEIQSEVFITCFSDLPLSVLVHTRH